MTEYRPTTLLNDLASVYGYENHTERELLEALYTNHETDYGYMGYDFANGRSITVAETKRGAWKADPENTRADRTAWTFDNASNGCTYSLTVTWVNYDATEEMPADNMVFEYNVSKVEYED